MTHQETFSCQYVSWADRLVWLKVKTHISYWFFGVSRIHLVKRASVLCSKSLGQEHWCIITVSLTPKHTHNTAEEPTQLSVHLYIDIKFILQIKFCGFSIKIYHGNKHTMIFFTFLQSVLFKYDIRTCYQTVSSFLLLYIFLCIWCYCNIKFIII